MVNDYISDLGLCRIRCYTLLHHTSVLSFNYSLSVANYQHRLMASAQTSLTG